MIKRVKKLAHTGLSVLLCSVLLSSCRGGSVSPSSMNANSLIQTANLQAGEPFQWGVSSAGYQAEGHDTTSAWYFWDISGKTEHRNVKGVDFLNRWEEDLDLAKSMGVNSFRFSIEWSRIEPRKGVIDPQGIQFYRNLINGIKARGMTPLVTLIHFNYPQWVVEMGGNRPGIENKDFIPYFLRYVDIVVREFGPDVKYWITFNEPNIWVPGAYLLGMTPPGKRNPLATVRATWNLLKAHSKAYDLIHKLDPDAMVSSNVFYVLAKPFGAITQPPGGVTAASTGVKLTEKNIMETDWFFESLASGNVTVDPQAIAEEGEVVAQNARPLSLAEDLAKTDLYGRPVPKTNQGQIKMKNDIDQQADSGVKWLGKFDYVAFDYYYRFRNLNQVINLTKFWDMELYPEGMYDAIMAYHRKYNKPVMIAENGIATENLKPRKDGWTRGAALVEHVKYIKQAMADGANVIGYYHWSITDNYEWGTFTPRFGLFSVDALNDPSMKRVPTDAVEAYKEVIMNNGVTYDLLTRYPRPGQLTTMRR